MTEIALDLTFYEFFNKADSLKKGSNLGGMHKLELCLSLHSKDLL